MQKVSKISVVTTQFSLVVSTTDWFCSVFMEGYDKGVKAIILTRCILISNFLQKNIDYIHKHQEIQHIAYSYNTLVFVPKHIFCIKLI